jgi:translation initiation factor IF-3
MQKKPKGRQPFRPRQKEREHRINEEITGPEVRVVGEDIEPGVYPVAQALRMAQDREMDLVEISPQANPPVCRIIDYNKFLYEKKKKDKEQKAKSKQSEVKEIRFTPNTDEHDFDFKSKHAAKFLQDGDKVKCYVQFRGRAIMFQERGELMLLKFAERLAEFGALESMPKMEGRRMIAIFTPKKKK